MSNVPNSLLTSTIFLYQINKHRVCVRMLKVRMMFLLMLMMMIECVWIKVVMSEVYNVGESDGWTTLVNSSYSTWASSKKFRVGDTLRFEYDPTSNNVVRVNQASFQLCNVTAPLRTYKTGNDFFTIMGPGHYYFICSFPSHCEAGQKLDVRVLKKITTPHVSDCPLTNATSATPPKAIAMAPRSVGLGSFSVLSIVYVVLWVG